MSRKSVFVAACLMVGCQSVVSSAATPDSTAKVIDQFVAWAQDNESVTDEQKAAAIDAVQSFREDETYRSLAIMSGLCEMYPEFDKAIQLWTDGELDSASEILKRLAKSEDQFLAAEATFYLAQTYMDDERHEEALPLLQQIGSKWSEHTVQAGSALYLEGVAQSKLLKRSEAIAALERYVEENPNAPERIRVNAWRQLEQLRSLQEGTLSDVYARMDYSRRHLKLAKTGDETQQQQVQIISMLDKLIKEAEDRECKSQSQSECEKCGKKDCQGQCEGEGEGEGKSKGKGGNSKNTDGVARKTYNNGPQSPWSKLRDRDRDPVYSAIKERFPARFEHIIEQYYKSFQASAEE